MSNGGESELKWYHVNGNTYGTWVRGDARGWRARHHREHVEGDYRNPPAPGTYEQLAEQSRRLMKRPPVLLTPPQRKIAGQSLVEMLLDLHVLLLAVSVTQVHYHILGKFPPARVRELVGRAKKHASFELHGHGLEGGAWGVRSRALPIRDRGHQLNVYRYILDHVQEGGWVWNFREGTPWRRG